QEATDAEARATFGTENEPEQRDNALPVLKGVKRHESTLHGGGDRPWWSARPRPVLRWNPRYRPARACRDGRAGGTGNSRSHQKPPPSVSSVELTVGGQRAGVAVSAPLNGI